MTFKDMMRLSGSISSETALSDAEASQLFLAATTLRPGSLILEIGCQYGRSSTLLAQIARDWDLRVAFVDPFIEPPDAGPQWLANMQKVGHPFTLYCAPSNNIIGSIGPIGLLYIDGDHSYEGVSWDLARFTPLVIGNGYVCCHDYMRDSLPGVTRAVDEWLTAGWELVSHTGTMGVWRRK